MRHNLVSFRPKDERHRPRAVRHRVYLSRGSTRPLVGLAFKQTARFAMLLVREQAEFGQ